MNLRDQLKEILPDILPRNPAQAIKGTELIELVKHRLKQDYSDATLRYHFSIMSCDPSSPIVKVEQGQGYYLRGSTIHSLHSARNFFPASAGDGSGAEVAGIDGELLMKRANKFRALVHRYHEALGGFPFSFEQSFSEDVQAARWRIPDTAVINWTTGERVDDGFVIDRRRLEVSRRLGQAPFRVGGLKMRLELSRSDLFELLHQCLSASDWANYGEIALAMPVEDPEMIDEIRRFTARYGVGVISFGLDADVLDDLPEPAVIENLLDREFESIQRLLAIRRLAVPLARREFDWQHVTREAERKEDFARFASWVSQSLLEERMVPVRDFQPQADGDSAIAREFVA